MLAAAFLSMFTTFGVAYSFGSFFRSMADEFHAGRAAVSVVFSLTAFLYFGLGSVSGRVSDRIGPRPVVLFGAAVMSLGLILTSMANRLWIGYITYPIGVGVGVACGYVPMVAAVSGWFSRRRTLAVGIAVAGVGMGTLSVNYLAAFLISRHGWRATYVIFGLATALVLGACGAAVAKPPEAAVDQRGPDLAQVLRARSFRLLYVSTLLMSLALFVPFVFLAEFAQRYGSTKVAASVLVGLLGGASVVGRLALGPLADRVGHVRAYQGCFLMMGLSFVIWLATTSYPLLVVYALVMGLSYGGFIALSPVVTADLFGLAGLGAVVGALYTSAAAGALLGPPLAGRLIDATGSYGWAIGLAMGLALASFAVLLPLRNAHETTTPVPAEDMLGA